MAKRQSTSGFLNLLLLTFFKVVLFFVNLLIFIGDSVRLVFNILSNAVITALKFWVKLFNLLAIALLDWVVKILGRISKIPRPNIRKPKRRAIGFDLPKIHRPHLKFGFGKISSKIKYFTFGAILATLLWTSYQGYRMVESLPNPYMIGRINFPVSTQIFDRNGKLLYEVYQDENREPVSLSEIPKDVIDATVAIEDKTFYSHNGISFANGILRAARETVLRENLQGGSTITQQLVKTSLLTPERTVTRKLKEMTLAIWTERIYSKDQILEMYLNQVAFGGTTYGIQEASKIYFGKPITEVTLSEAALLAGLPQAPSLYSPQADLDRAINRRNEVLRRMFEDNYISQSELDTAMSQAPTILPPKNFIEAPHFVFFVRDWLEEKYGPNMIYSGGLRVKTSLDLEVQKNAESLVSSEVDAVRNLNVGNGAALVTVPRSGEILAMVGSTNYYDDKYGAYNATTAIRQPGSSIKPLMYSLALQNGFTAATTISDTPISFPIPGAQAYVPQNYDGRYHGLVTVRQALANSYNIPAVKILNEVGVDRFIDQAQLMGISTWGDRSRFGLSLTLGGGEVRMVDMAEAYGVFANEGLHVPLNPIIEIRDYRGNLVYSQSSSYHEDRLWFQF